MKLWDLSKAACVSLPTISDFLKNDTKNLRMDTMLHICEGFNITLKDFLNDFLDHFIGWNFGVTIKSNPQLEKELLEFNSLVISKGLREAAGPGFDVWCSDDVQHYMMKTS